MSSTLGIVAFDPRPPVLRATISFMICSNSFYTSSVFLRKSTFLISAWPPSSLKMPWIFAIELLVVRVGDMLRTDEPSFVSVISYLTEASMFWPFGLNKFIYPGLTLLGDFLELGFTTLTVELTYSSLAMARLTSGSRVYS